MQEAGNLCCNLEKRLAFKLTSKAEVAHVDRSGDRRGSTKAHEADPLSAEHKQMKLYHSQNSSFRAIRFLWLPKKVNGKLQSCFCKMSRSINNEG